MLELLLADAFAALPPAFPATDTLGAEGTASPNGPACGEVPAFEEDPYESDGALSAARLKLCCSLVRDLHHLALLPKLGDGPHRHASPCKWAPATSTSAAAAFFFSGAAPWHPAARAGGGDAAHPPQPPPPQQQQQQQQRRQQQEHITAGAAAGGAARGAGAPQAMPTPAATLPLFGPSLTPLAVDTKSWSAAALPLPVALAARLGRLLVPLLACNDDDCLHADAADAAGFPPAWMGLVPGAFPRV